MGNLIDIVMLALVLGWACFCGVVWKVYDKE
jgi:hypothetical protein